MARFVLIQPSHNGNVGAAARAMKTMGFDELVLVEPRDPKVLNREETIQRASGANDVLSKARIVASLDDALQGVNHLCATAMTARDFGPATFAPRAYFERLKQQSSPPGEDCADGARDWGFGRDLNMAFLFGTERFGMRNEHVYRCHAALCIPANPKYGSLNLASAVQLIAYEWRQALQAYEVAATAQRKLADAAAVSKTLLHWEEALIHLGFLDPSAPKKLMPRLQDVFNRAQLREEEVHILRGIAKAMLETSAHRAAKQVNA